MKLTLYADDNDAEALRCLTLTLDSVHAHILGKTKRIRAVLNGVEEILDKEGLK